MRRAPQAAARIVDLAPGVSAAAPGVLWLHASRAIVAADLHLGYEDVIGGALPAWSAGELTGMLMTAAERMQAREILLLGDVVHAARMSAGAGRAVRAALNALRSIAQLTLIAGNHEGRSRGAELLGDTVDAAERDGWLLLHGDRPVPAGARCIIGHLHPSLALEGSASAPAFLASSRLLVVPALTPYSRGLDVLSGACLDALRPWGVGSRRDLHVVAAAGDLLYPFGTLSELHKVRKWLRPGG